MWLLLGGSNQFFQSLPVAMLLDYILHINIEYF
jgi:hypothetical protein